MYVKVCNVQGSAAVTSSQLQGPIRGREGFELITGDYVDLFRLMVRANELPDADMYAIDTWEEEDFLDRPKVSSRRKQQKV